MWSKNTTSFNRTVLSVKVQCFFLQIQYHYVFLRETAKLAYNRSIKHCCLACTRDGRVVPWNAFASRAPGFCLWVPYSHCIKQNCCFPMFAFSISCIPNFASKSCFVYTNRKNLCSYFFASCVPLKNMSTRVPKMPGTRETTNGHPHLLAVLDLLL